MVKFIKKYKEIIFLLVVITFILYYLYLFNDLNIWMEFINNDINELEKENIIKQNETNKERAYWLTSIVMILLWIMGVISIERLIRRWI